MVSLYYHHTNKKLCLNYGKLVDTQQDICNRNALPVKLFAHWLLNFSDERRNASVFLQNIEKQASHIMVQKLIITDE